MRIQDLVEYGQKPPKEVFDTIQTLWDRGLSYQEIADETGRTKINVTNLIRRYMSDRPRRDKIADETTILQLKSYLSQGLSNAEIAKKLDRSTRSVEGLIRRLPDRPKR